MSARWMIVGSAVFVVACATAQENPNYEYSTKYKSSETQMASNDAGVPYASEVVIHSHSEVPQSTVRTAQAQTQPAQVYNPIPAAHPSTHGHSPSPTEEAYDPDTMMGTPGYEAMRAQERADSYAQQPQSSYQGYQTAPAYQPAPSYQPPATTYQAPAPAYSAPPPPPPPRAVNYDYGPNISRSDSVGAPPAGTRVNVATNQSYVVRPGDTIYSMARRLCVPMTDITVPNGIGADYAISVGQTLSLPYSRCQP